MGVSEIRVEARKTVSDSNFGNESCTISLVAAVAEGENALETARELAAQAAALVRGRLRASETPAVRRALMGPAELEGEVLRERDAEYARRRRPPPAGWPRQQDAGEEVDQDGRPF